MIEFLGWVACGVIGFGFFMEFLCENFSQSEIDDTFVVIMLTNLVVLISGPIGLAMVLLWVAIYVFFGGKKFPTKLRFH